MTDKAVSAVQRVAGSTAQVRGLTAQFGEPVIASRQSFAIGAHAALQLVHREGAWADVIVLACFGDPGLEALREAIDKPVIGMARSALREAKLRAQPIHIITAGAAWDAMLRETVQLELLTAQLHGITVLPSDGLAIARAPEAFIAQIQKVLDRLSMSRSAITKSAPTAILGGLGFAGIHNQLRYDGHLIDGLDAAVRAAVQAE